MPFTTTQTANYTLAETGDLRYEVTMDTSAGDLRLKLPPHPFHSIRVVVTNSGANHLYVEGVIDGRSTKLVHAGESYQLQWLRSDGIYITEPESVASGSSSNAPNCIYLPGGDTFTSSPHLFGGAFFPQDAVNQGSFCTEFWARWDAGGSCYIISDGKGGWHQQLIGWTTIVIDGKTYAYPSGNISGFPFSAPGCLVRSQQWAHYQVRYDVTSRKVLTFVDGILAGVDTGPVERKSLVNDLAAGGFFVGGSDHNQFTGALAGMRGWDNNKNPYGVDENGFFPDRRMGEFRGTNQLETVKPDFVYDCTGSGMIVTDESQGRAGVRHSLAFANLLDPNGPVPQRIYDANCPSAWSSVGTVVTGAEVRPLGTVPAGAIIFDDGSGADSTPVHGKPNTTAPGLGDAPVGLTGQRTYTEVDLPVLGSGANSSGMRWSRRDGRLRYVGNASRSAAWLECGTANHYVSIDIVRAVAARQSVGLVFRWVDANNFWYVSVFQNDSGWLTYGKVVGGAHTQIAQFAPNPGTTWTTLSANCNGNVITIKTDGTTVRTDTDSSLNTATKVGPMYYGNLTSLITSGWAGKNLLCKAAN